jgi:hypothetical protein
VKASSFRSGYDPCPVCRAEGYKQRAAARRTDAAEATALRAHGFEPLEPYPGSSVGWHCRCTTWGKESKPLYSGVKGRGYGCGHCAGGPACQSAQAGRPVVQTSTGPRVSKARPHHRRLPLRAYPAFQEYSWSSSGHDCSMEAPAGLALPCTRLMNGAGRNPGL